MVQRLSSFNVTPGNNKRRNSLTSLLGEGEFACVRNTGRPLDGWGKWKKANNVERLAKAISSTYNNELLLNPVIVTQTP